MFFSCVSAGPPGPLGRPGERGMDGRKGDRVSFFKSAYKFRMIRKRDIS